MHINQEVNVSDVVSENIQAAHIFKKYGIDFCCGGGVSIEKICLKKNIDVALLLQDLNTISDSSLPSQQCNRWELDFLIDYIIHTHHSYVLESLDLIDEYATKVVKVHGTGHPAVIEIARLFKQVAMDLSSHMRKEEMILFPYIKKLVAVKKQQTALEESHVGSVFNPIQIMQEEHEVVGNVLKQIRVLSESYAPPSWACNTFKALYAKLDEFEQDLHLHIHLENNILFPKAIALESMLMHSYVE